MGIVAKLAWVALPVLAGGAALTQLPGQKGGTASGGKASLVAPESVIRAAYDPYFTSLLERPTVKIGYDSKRDFNPKDPQGSMQGPWTPPSFKSWEDPTLPFKTTREERQLVSNRLWKAVKELPKIEDLPMGDTLRKPDNFIAMYDRVFKSIVPENWSSADKAYMLFKLSNFFAVENLEYNKALGSFPAKERAASIRGSENSLFHLSGVLTSVQNPKTICTGFANIPAELFNGIVERHPELKGYSALQGTGDLRFFGNPVTTLQSRGAGHTVLSMATPEGRYIYSDPTQMNNIAKGAGNIEPAWSGHGPTGDAFTFEAFLSAHPIAERRWSGAFYNGFRMLTVPVFKQGSWDEIRSDPQRFMRISELEKQYRAAEAKFNAGVGL